MTPTKRDCRNPDKWLRGPSRVRVEGVVKLPKAKECTCCHKYHTHSEIVCCVSKDGLFYFQCECGSTLTIFDKQWSEEFVEEHSVLMCA